MPTQTQVLGDSPVKGGVTFAHQDSLKKLPIPVLEDTCTQYLAAVRPLQTPYEFEDTKAAVEEFLENEGPELQERLLKYASTRSSYIEQFWYDSYLNYDKPVVLNLNPFFLLEDDPTPAASSQVNRAASICISSLNFIRALRREELQPDDVRGTKLCMYQYSRIFGTARIPTDTGCVMQSDNTTKHVVVMARSQFYWFDVLDDNSDIIMTEKDLSQNFRTIIEDAQNTPINEAAKGAVGVLTTENRRIWAGVRDLLTADENSNNARCLKIIDTALFIVCLDYATPETTAELAQEMLCGTNVISNGIQCGTCTNRWYDKLQIIVTANGSAGINFEHTGVDGHTVLRFASDVYTDTILRFAKSINGFSPSLWKTQSPDPSKRDPATFGNVTTTPHKLEWEMIPELSMALRFAESQLADLIHQNEFKVLEFDGFGADWIKSMGFSPDAFVQMAFQASYYALYGHVDCLYEPAMTKQFLHGRTEAVRPVSQESLNFVRKFCENVPPQQKIEALRAACDRHVAITRQCSKGLGQDRHLYALFCIWQRFADEVVNENEAAANAAATTDGEDGTTTTINSDLGGTNGKKASAARRASTTNTPELPSIFADPGWDKLNNTLISTSNCGNPSLRLFGFGPTSVAGYGIGYIIKQDSICFGAASKHRQTQRFLDTLQNYLIEVSNMLRLLSPAKASGTRARSPDRVKRRPTSHRYGRVVTGTSTPRLDEATPSAVKGDMLSGYGYFDMGEMEVLLRDIGANKSGVITPRSAGHPHHHHARRVNDFRREVSRKLKLSDA